MYKRMRSQVHQKALHAIPYIIPCKNEDVIYSYCLWIIQRSIDCCRMTEILGVTLAERWVLRTCQCATSIHSLRRTACVWHLNIRKTRGAWVAQLGKYPTWAQVMISRSVSLSPTLGSVLTAQSLEPALESVSPSFSVPPLLVLSLCLSLSLSLSQK